MVTRSLKDLEGLREIGRIVADCIHYMSQQLKPGITTEALDRLGEAFLTEHGARSAPRLVYKFPGATCISVNEQVAHGIPGPRVLKAGDLVNIDVSAEKWGYFGDTGGSFVMEPQASEWLKLCAATRRALEAGIKVARAGQPVNGIGKAIEEVANSEGYTVIRNLGSHGVGLSLHEEPKFIAGFYDRKDKRILRENQVITIEPFLSTGADWADELDDGWTLATDAKYRTAQFEHSMVIQKDKDPIILTQRSS